MSQYERFQYSYLILVGRFGFFHASYAIVPVKINHKYRKKIKYLKKLPGLIINLEISISLNTTGNMNNQNSPLPIKNKDCTKMWQ